MDEGTESDTVIKINIPTKSLHYEVIQELLHKVRSKRTKLDQAQWSQVLHILWEHLETGLKRFDDQLLCSVCLYTALEFSHEKELYFDKILILINNELALKNKLKLNKEPKHLSEMKTFLVVSLMYGMLQSKCIVQISYKELPIMVDILSSSLDLLILMAYEYSRYTFIVFKILSSFKIITDTDLREKLFLSDTNNIVKLLNLANQNWENPITGVRDLNKCVFQNVLSICSKEYFRTVLYNLENIFYWNKAKYLMVAVMIEREYNLAPPDHWIKVQEHWLDGLMSSLNKPGLVSAGADMYFAVLKKLLTEDEWCSFFLYRTLDVLQGSSIKAIENFCNYWCLTTFKKFPSVAKILIDELEKVEETKTKLYSSLCILKQANKLGLVHKKWSTGHYGFAERNVLDGIEHPNAQLRMLAFEIVAVTVGKAMPTSEEYSLILNYLYNNINSDCTVLRISMLANIQFFLTHLCASYLEHARNRQNWESDLQNFYKSLQEFIIESLNFDGNYQRKITTIKLCHILLSSLSEIPKKRQKQTCTSGAAVIKFLKDKDCFILLNDNILLKLLELLKDPANDVRDNVVQLLLDHYSKKITATLLNQLIEDAKNYIRSKFFYQISCGQSMFRLITSLILKENYTGTTFESIEDVFNFAYDVLNSEYGLKRDIVKSIEEGKQLHAYLCILQELLKVSKQFSYELKSLKKEIPQLLNILEAVSDQFAWEEDPAVSSDFSKMSDMVQSIIAESGYNPLDEKDFSKISGLQQIVLNCLWLNVKASCDFASSLITFFSAESEAEVCGKCLRVITRVLETSRHKGAIEAAGAALGNAIQHLTSLPADGALSRQPRSLLQCKLCALLSAAAASVTRRGAGLSIMVHRIVASDMEKGKPLFHYFMETLLRTCNSEDMSGAADDGQRDLPKAVYIHFLTRIVTDSSLASDMMYYSADLAEIAFGNLTSPHWQIRNAALQLYGALVPKLIGQKKASGTSDETVGTVAIDEFRTHSPRLWRHMMTCLQHLDETNAVESHSNVLPVLNVLANLAKRYSFEEATFPDSKDLLERLNVLLGSPIFTVRRLTAKCIFNIYGLEVLDNLTEKIKANQISGENLLHGCLLLIQHYCKHLHNNKTAILPVLDELSLFMTQSRHSYINRTEFEYFSSELCSVKDVLSEVKCNRYLPGVHHWANKRIQKYVQLCSWNEVPELCKIFLGENDSEKYYEFVLEKLKLDCNISEEVLTEIGDVLLKSDTKFQSCVCWKILYHISSQIDFTNIDVDIIDHLQTGISYRIRYMIPFLASIADKVPITYVIKLSDLILALCDPDKSDVDMRHIAALANNELAKAFSNIPDEVRIPAIKSAVLLLQDEDEDVRIINVHFYSNITKQDVILQPFICLANILDKSFLESCLDDPDTGIPAICESLLEIIVSYAKSDELDDYNPFSNDSKNIYFEPEVVKKLIHDVKRSLDVKCT